MMTRRVICYARNVSQIKVNATKRAVVRVISLLLGVIGVNSFESYFFSAQGTDVLASRDPVTHAGGVEKVVGIARKSSNKIF
jgi:hypothetical protein